MRLAHSALLLLRFFTPFKKLVELILLALFTLVTSGLRIVLVVFEELDLQVYPLGEVAREASHLELFVELIGHGDVIATP